MIDDGELDWKVVAIAATDPMADKLNDIDDVEKEMPGTLSGIREWFRWYKTPDDKPLNSFGYDEKFLDKEEAMKVTCGPDACYPYPTQPPLPRQLTAAGPPPCLPQVIAETHESWKGLKDGSIDKGKLWIN